MGEGACKSASGRSTVDNLHSSTAAGATRTGSDGNDPLPAQVGRGILRQKPANPPTEMMQMQITKEKLIKARTRKNGYSLAQIEMAIGLVGSPWAKAIVGTEVPEKWWRDFCMAKVDQSGRATSKKAINPMPQKAPEDWSWQPKTEDIPALKVAGSNKKKRKLVTKKDNSEFYASDEWRALRMRVIEKNESKCMACGRSPKNHGVVIHVDHIKPRSKYPQLSLAFDNLQLLCEDCNFGKGNKYITDWRP